MRVEQFPGGRKGRVYASQKGITAWKVAQQKSQSTPEFTPELISSPPLKTNTNEIEFPH
jgi:hypothetical protein